MKFEHLKYTIILVFLLGIISCSKNEEEEVQIPTGILSQDSLIKVMTDFALAESASNLNILNLSGRKYDSAYAFNPLVENKISKAHYDSSVAFYSKNPELFKQVHDEVLTALNNLLVEREKVKKDTTSKKDTLSKK